MLFLYLQGVTMSRLVKIALLAGFASSQMTYAQCPEGGGFVSVNTNGNPGGMISWGAELGYQRVGEQTVTVPYIGEGTYVCRGASLADDVAVLSRSYIGNDVLLAKGVMVGEDVRLDEGVIINSGSVVSNNVKIGSKTFVGSNSLIAKGAQVGQAVSIGAFVKIGEYAVVEDSARIENYVHVPPNSIVEAGEVRM